MVLTPEDDELHSNSGTSPMLEIHGRHRNTSDINNVLHCSFDVCDGGDVDGRGDDGSVDAKYPLQTLSPHEARRGGQFNDISHSALNAATPSPQRTSSHDAAELPLPNFAATYVNESVSSLDESNHSSEIAQGDKQSNVILPGISKQNIAISIVCNRRLISLSNDPGGTKQGTSFDADIVFSSANIAAAAAAAAASTSTGDDNEPMKLGGIPLEDYDYPTLHDLYEQLLRSGKENQSRLDAVRELLCARRRKQLAEDAEMLARTNRFNDKNVAIMTDLWNPNGMGQCDFLDLDRKEVANNIDPMNWKASDERKAMSASDRLKIDLRFREKGIKIKEERVKQTAALEGGNITLEGGEKGWVANMGETAVQHKTRGIEYLRYATENEAGYVEGKRVVSVKGTDVIASTTSHRMDRFGNVCLNTATEIMFQHTQYYTAKEEGESPEWRSANTQAAHDAVALVDHNMIVLHKGEGVGEFGMPDEKKLLKQRIEYAEQNGMTEDITNNVEVTDLNYVDYECLDCRGKPQYSEKYYVPNVDLGVEKGAYNATCFCCGKKQNLLNERSLIYRKTAAVHCRLVPKRNRTFSEYQAQHDNMKKEQKKANTDRKRKRAASEDGEFTVDAPKGTLGIILRNRADSRGTVVDEVRPTSVLVKQVSPGDRIIAIDDVDVRQLNVAEITAIMAKKSASGKVLTILAAPKMSP